MTSVTEQVAQKLTEIAPAVEDQVVKTLVDRQVKKRSDALVVVLDKIDQLNKDLKKVRPDQVFFDAAGKEQEAFYSKPRLQEKQKLEQQISKFEKAINKALEQKDYTDVFSIAAGKSPSEDSSGDTATSD